MCKLCVNAVNGICEDVTIYGNVECCDKIMCISNVIIHGNLVANNKNNLFTIRSLIVKNIEIIDCPRLIFFEAVFASAIYMYNVDVLTELKGIECSGISIDECPNLFILDDFKTEQFVIGDCSSLMKEPGVFDKNNQNFDNIFAKESRIFNFYFL